MSEDAKVDGRDAEEQKDDGTSKETGTPEAQSDDGTDEAEGQDNLKSELEKLKEEKQQLLGQKTKWEEGQRELERLRANPPTSETQPQAQREYQEFMQVMGHVQRLADAGDPVARVQLHNMQMQEHWRREQMIQSQLSVIPAEEREEVKQGFLKNAHRFADVDAYYEAVQGKKLKDRVKELEEKQKQLDRARATRENVDKVGTTTVSVGAEEHKKRKMTFSEYRELTSRGGQKAIEALEEKDAGRLEIDYSK